VIDVQLTPGYRGLVKLSAGLRSVDPPPKPKACVQGRPVKAKPVPGKLLWGIVPLTRRAMRTSTLWEISAEQIATARMVLRYSRIHVMETALVNPVPWAIICPRKDLYAGRIATVTTVTEIFLRTAWENTGAVEVAVKATYLTRSRNSVYFLLLPAKQVITILILGIVRRIANVTTASHLPD